MLTKEQVRAALEALSPTEEKVDLAVKAAVEIAQPSRVILFGSWARGEARWNSDLDLAVLLPDSAAPGRNPSRPSPQARSSPNDHRLGDDN